MRRAAVALGVVLLAGCAQLAVQAQDSDAGPAPDVTPAPAAEAPVVLGEGLASWYGLAFQGRRTASGERFDMNAFTAAHPTLPFGTRVLVRNPRNDRAVVVRINDRGPFVPGRIIDLSHAAARALGMLSFGPKVVVLTEPGPEHAGAAAGRRR
jgi:rare lipoprotein A